MAKNFGLVVVGGRPGDIVASGHERSLSELSRAGGGVRLQWRLHAPGLQTGGGGAPLCRQLLPQDDAGGGDKATLQWAGIPGNKV